MKQTLLFSLIVLSSMSARAQQMLDRSAIRSLEKEKWEKAERQIRKTFRKDSLNAPGKYIFATYYFDTANPAFNIDSAYYYVMASLRAYTSSEEKERERMARLPLDTAVLIALRQQIDSAAFARATKINTEASYLDFLKRFPYAIQQEQARELRDEVAYLDALKVNTYQAYADYLSKYPAAHRAADAQSRYDRLLFEAKTGDKHLASYRKFLNDNPQTPYRPIVEKNIFEIATASGTPGAYRDFILEFPRSPYARAARNLAYYLEEELHLPHEATIMNDSLRTVEELAPGYLVPMLVKGRYGFINSKGKEIIAPSVEDLPADYLCGNIVEDVLVFPDRIVSIGGEVVYTGKTNSMDDLGAGFMVINDGTCNRIIHKSGMVFHDGCVEDAQLVAHNFLLITRNEKHELWTLGGRRLLAENPEDVQMINGIFALKLKGEWWLANLLELARAADHYPVRYTGPFDDVRAGPLNGIWVKRNSEEAILASSLQPVIPMAAHRISESYFGATAKSLTGVVLYNQKSGPSPQFQQLKVSEPWTAVREAERWRLYDPELKTFLSSGFDSLLFYGPFAVGRKADSSTVFFDREKKQVWRAAQFEFLPGKSSDYFLIVTQDKVRTLYDKQGKKLFVADYESVQYLDEGLFLVTKKTRQGIAKGVVNTDGKVEVPLDFDAVGNYSDGVLAVLKSMKFGIVRLSDRKQIKPAYDKNVIRYNDMYLAAFKNGGYGFIDWDNKPLSEFEFDDVKPWNDSAALVKKGSQWMIYDIAQKKPVVQSIRRYRVVKDTPEEKIFIVIQDNHYGVISNTRGVVIPATFSDIVNVGSVEQPLYFTEKHVEEASLFVVIYYDAEGNYLTRQTYEVDDYERIYCSGK